jgi:hypothetical protein
VFRYFETADLVPVLKPLLSDPGYEVRSADQNKGIEVHTFRVRQEAYAMLKRLKANVDPPIEEESISRPAHPAC